MVVNLYERLLGFCVFDAADYPHATNAQLDDVAAPLLARYQHARQGALHHKCTAEPRTVDMSWQIVQSSLQLRGTSKSSTHDGGRLPTVAHTLRNPSMDALSPCCSRAALPSSNSSKTTSGRTSRISCRTSSADAFETCAVPAHHMRLVNLTSAAKTQPMASWVASAHPQGRSPSRCVGCGDSSWFLDCPRPEPLLESPLC